MKFALIYSLIGLIFFAIYLLAVTRFPAVLYDLVYAAYFLVLYYKGHSY